MTGDTHKNSLIGLYIHIPFCVAKCPYCDFYSIPFNESAADSYVAALINAMLRHPFGEKIVDTVYFGGGTPSILGAPRLLRVLERVDRCFKLDPNAEITFEANPGAVSGQSLSALRRGGFNRISFGVQSLNDGELTALGRIHTAAEARQAIGDAHLAGFSDISADVMLAVPGQTVDSLTATLDELLDMPVSHLSAYLLGIEEGTPFDKQNIARLAPHEDEAARLYLCCAEKLSRHGFYHYEISNFAKAGAVSRHNLKYWQCEEYLGLGSSAHSFIDGRRFYFPRDIESFCQTKTPWSITADDGAGGEFEEYAMLRLRLGEGLDLTECERLFGADIKIISAKAKQLEDQGLLTLSEDRISLTPQGWLLGNAVTCRLILD